MVSQATRAALRRHRINLIYYPSFSSREVFESNFYVNIDDYIKKKMEILDLFVSQKDRFYLSKSFIKIKAKEAGLTVGYNFAERFFY